MTLTERVKAAVGSIQRAEEKEQTAFDGTGIEVWVLWILYVIRGTEIKLETFGTTREDLLALGRKHFLSHLGVILSLYETMSLEERERKRGDYQTNLREKVLQAWQLELPDDQLQPILDRMNRLQLTTL